MQLVMIPIEEYRDLHLAASRCRRLRADTRSQDRDNGNAIHRQTRALSDWLSWYVSGYGMDMVHKVYGELRSREPEPFSGWQRWTTDVPQMGPADHDRLRRHLIAGGIGIVLGRAPVFQGRFHKHPYSRR